MPAEGEGGEGDIARLGEIAGIVQIAVIDDLELVARLQIALEVDVVAEGADDVGHDGDRHALVLARLEEAGMDDAGGARALDIEGQILRLDGEPAILIARQLELTLDR